MDTAAGPNASLSWFYLQMEIDYIYKQELQVKQHSLVSVWLLSCSSLKFANCTPSVSPQTPYHVYSTRNLLTFPTTSTAN